MLTELQKRTAQAIVNIFETGSVRGEYGQVTVLPGDSGHLTYGRAQTTIASGNLFLLIKAYINAPQAQQATTLSTYLSGLEVRDLSLDHDVALHNVLRDAGDDPVMQDVQDSFFDRVYWEPSISSANAVAVSESLGVAIIYDSRIHGSWRRMRDRTIDQYNSVADQSERQWIQHYVATRRHWLANHSNHLLRRTVYRMDAFGVLFEDDAWDLALPLTIRGARIDEAALSDSPPLRVSADDGFNRMLRLKDPRMRGDDVVELQQLLGSAGADIQDDGEFGPATDSAVRSFQKSNGLSDDGIVGPATISALHDATIGGT